MEEYCLVASGVGPKIVIHSRLKDTFDQFGWTSLLIAD